MSCSYQLEENFNAGTPPFLGYSGYPGSDFPQKCTGSGAYGGYGACGCQNEGSELDHPHDSSCQCQQCQQPYSMPYEAPQSACQNPLNCDGNCQCNANEVADLGEGHMADKLFDLGLTNGTGLKAHLRIPFLNIHVDFQALLRFAILILIISAIAYYFLGLRLRR